MQMDTAQRTRAGWINSCACARACRIACLALASAAASSQAGSSRLSRRQRRACEAHQRRAHSYSRSARMPRPLPYSTTSFSATSASSNLQGICRIQTNRSSLRRIRPRWLGRRARIPTGVGGSLSAPHASSPRFTTSGRRCLPSRPTCSRRRARASDARSCFRSSPKSAHQRSLCATPAEPCRPCRSVLRVEDSRHSIATASGE